MTMELTEELVGRIGDFLENHLMEDTPSHWDVILAEYGGFKWANNDCLDYRIIILDDTKFTQLILSV